MYSGDTLGLKGSLGGSSGSLGGECVTYDSYGKHVDGHTILLYSEFASKSQILNVLVKCQEKYNRDIKSESDPPNTEIHVNVVLNRDDHPIGISYIWVSSPGFYNILLGKNIDGSDRTELIRDYDPTDTDYQSISDWSDIVEFDDNNSHVEILEPLINIPKITLTDDQYKLAIKVTKNIEYNREIELYPKAAFVLEPEEGNSSFELCCSRCPSWITANQLASIFKRYIPIDRRSDGYPKVAIRNPYQKKGFKIATVKFDPSTRDAQFALLMTKKINLTNRKNNQRVTLFFKFAKICRGGRRRS